MLLSISGMAIIQHVDTSERFEIRPEDLAYDETVEDPSRGMGSEISHTAQINHEKLGHLSWYVAEYPIGVENAKETDCGRHRLIQDFDYGLIDDPEPEDEEEFHALDDPSVLPEMLKNDPGWANCPNTGAKWQK